MTTLAAPDDTATPVCAELVTISRAAAPPASQIAANQLAVFIPSDLPRYKDEKATGGDAVGLSRDATTLVKMASHPWRADSRSLNRCNLPVCVFGKASINLIARGYLYGAITAFT